MNATMSPRERHNGGKENNKISNIARYVFQMRRKDCENFTISNRNAHRFRKFITIHIGKLYIGFQFFKIRTRLVLKKIIVY